MQTLVQYHFHSILNVLIHFSFSLTQLISILAILGIQIALTITQTCPYQFGIGFWSFPFLLMSPLSIWFVLWRRNSIACFIAILLQFCSTLFATAILIVSFLVLINRTSFICSLSSLNSFYIILNGSLIGIVLLFKLFSYGEVLLLYFVLRNMDDSSSIFFQDNYENNEPNCIHVNVWRSWSAVIDENQRNSEIFFA
ncbi:unnamed protein product [Adineta ricciae]|uniref:Uncharacterized protein n=1 Tax=Adineta ricciae TaxID=249248 RepID=A0A814FRS9_ADIRI|nr:unnamed protein product [Adineta ricciae]CAF0987385.1 unnamed protein product [Adineta ricciae]